VDTLPTTGSREAPLLPDFIEEGKNTPVAARKKSEGRVIKVGGGGRGAWVL